MYNAQNKENFECGFCWDAVCLYRVSENVINQNEYVPFIGK